MTLPAETLKEIIALRKENGLEATEAAVTASLVGLKYHLKETPRYRRAGRSPIYLPGKLLTAKGTDPVTGEQDSSAPKTQAAGKQASSAKRGGEVKAADSMQFYRVLHGRGFQIKVTRDEITGEVETKLPKALEDLALQFGEYPSSGEGIYVTQTSPKVLVTLSLDKFIELTGLKP